MPFGGYQYNPLSLATPDAHHASMHVTYPQTPNALSPGNTVLGGRYGGLPIV